MPLPYPTLPGDVDHLVVDDHALVERLFQHFEAGRGDRQRLADQIAFNVNLHADAEERTFYPALKEIGRSEDAEHLLSEHQQVKELVKTVEGSKPGETDFEDAMVRIIADIRTHAADEEVTFLPELRAGVGAERMGELGKTFLAAKRTAPTYSHPAAPAGKTGHAMLDAGAAVVDKLRDKTSGRMAGLATDPSGLLDPQAQRLLDAFAALEPKPIETLEPDQARKQPTIPDAVRSILAEDGKSTDPEPVGSVEDITIDGPAGPITVRVYKPASADGAPLPIVLWIHGGGWVLYDLDTYDASCRGLTNRTPAIVVSPDYRKAPEAVFPASHDDVLATYRWLAINGAQLGGDPARIAIGGESVGATMAAATCLQLKADGVHPPVAQVLVYPLTTGEQFGESMADAADARPLNRPLLSWMAMHAFQGVPQAATDPRVDLLSLSGSQLSGLPPALVITDERDVLRSQGRQFAVQLDAAGVPTQASHYDGVSHEFFGASAVLDKAEQAQQEAATFIRERLRTPAPTG